MSQTFTISNRNIASQFTMHQAKVEHTSDILALLVESAKWLQSKGSTQWNALLDGVDSHNTEVAIQRGDVFICKDGEEIAGMVMLLTQPSEWDRQLWGPKANRNDGAIYLHRLAIRRKYANCKLGESILNWCYDSISFEGKEMIRLDCVANNEHLNQFYRRNGYTYLGEKNGYSLYEK
ncbi:N-acetyltransferase [Sporosarcina pasteurii]|uniref:Acetyltransferase (GNAT) family n=1 Tax=Sporosarcina pasteurii TaxID=1474 RepID=A0A380BQF2_SPOPA|nr:GNAT family N-acetyltransferase [Sporosarcina pasteurii]MDS9471129.1 GNAT family N-acetyltransferase [Sporosarcina pasteurii]QBQ05230.1 GNAT family N-acetyltransferase [Sporosarcina pasteurii]SUJ05020.1 Acetyltransferase (GNAT) family [Sporosarcina pasteurii]